MTFEQIRKAAAEFWSANPGSPLADEVDNMIDCARINADDTCYIEKSRPVEDYDAVALDSLEQACGYAESHQAEAVAWLVAHGVKF